MEAVVHAQHERFVGDFESTQLAVVLLYHEPERRHEVVVSVIHQHSCTVDSTITTCTSAGGMLIFLVTYTTVLTFKPRRVRVSSSSSS